MMHACFLHRFDPQERASGTCVITQMRQRNPAQEAMVPGQVAEAIRRRGPFGIASDYVVQSNLVGK